MSNKKNKNKKKKKVRNKSKDLFMDYYKTGVAYDEENRRRQQSEGGGSKGLKNLNSFEIGCIVVIVLAIIGFIIKIFVLGHSVTDIGL